MSNMLDDDVKLYPQFFVDKNRMCNEYCAIVRRDEFRLIAGGKEYSCDEIFRLMK